MITYKKDEIFVYDDRDFIKYEYANNSNLKRETTKCKDNKENEREENLNNKKINNVLEEKQTNLFESMLIKEKESKIIKENIQFKEFNDDDYVNNDNNNANI